MQNGEATSSTPTPLPISGGDIVVEALARPASTCLDVRAGGRRLALWFANGHVGSADGNPADTLAIVLTLAPDSFVYSLADDDGIAHIAPDRIMPVPAAIEEATALVHEARDFGWMIPSIEHVVRWSPRLGRPAHVDAPRWRALALIGTGQRLAGLAVGLGGELAARRMVRDLLDAGLVVVEEPAALRTTVRVPPRSPSLPTSVAPVAPVAPVVAERVETVATEPVVAAPPDASAPALDAPVAQPSVAREPEASAPAPVPADAGWGQAPQVEEELGWGEAPPPATTPVTWADAPAEEEAAGWDDDVVHTEEVVGWDQSPSRTAVPAAASTTSVAPAVAPTPASAPRPPTAPAAPKVSSVDPSTPPASAGEAHDDAVSRALLYQFLSSMRS